MFKRIVQVSIAAMVLSLFTSLNSVAIADVYVKVDANGNAIGGAIICDAGTCGPDSLYSKLTLQPGERYVLQGTGQAGIGNNNPGIDVKVDLETNVWTVTNSQSNTVVQQFTPQTSPGNDRPTTPQVIIQDTKTVNSETSTSTSIVDSRTSSAIQDTSTVINNVTPQLIALNQTNKTTLEKDLQLQVSIKSKKQTLINLSTDYSGANLIVTATKKGAKDVVFKVTTDSNGDAQLKTTKNLSGFTVVLSIGKVKLDTDIVRK